MPRTATAPTQTDFSRAYYAGQRQWIWAPVEILEPNGKTAYEGFIFLMNLSPDTPGEATLWLSPTTNYLLAKTDRIIKFDKQAPVELRGNQVALDLPDGSRITIQAKIIA